MKKQLLLLGLCLSSLHLMALPTENDPADSNQVPADTVVYHNGNDKDSMASATKEMEMLKLEVEVFPNPATTYAIVKLPQEILDENKATLNLYGATGQMIYQRENIRLAQVKLMTENLPYGLYYVEVLSGDSRVLKKLMVKRP